MAKPPAGSSLLFGALADSGRIKKRKNGSYRMVLKGVDEIDWFTDRPDRVAGEWSPKKLVEKWDGLFGGDEPNAQATFEMGSKRELATFEMFKPKLGDSNQKLSFKVRGIGKKNKDLLTGLREKQLSDVSLFIDNSLPACMPDCQGASLRDAFLAGLDLSHANLTDADLSYANLRYAKMYFANLTGANLTGADMFFVVLSRAVLAGQDLSGADLRHADLRGADLRGADLTQARMFSADLRGANLTDANLSGTDLNSAHLTEADLTGAQLTGADLNGPISWWYTICPDGTKNSGTSPCTPEQLNLA